MGAMGSRPPLVHARGFPSLSACSSRRPAAVRGSYASMAVATSKTYKTAAPAGRVAGQDRERVGDPKSACARAGQAAVRTPAS